MKEINFNQSKKDLTEAKIHHLLSEEMSKPVKNFRKLSYRYFYMIRNDFPTRLTLVYLHTANIDGKQVILHVSYKSNAVAY